MWDLGDAEVKDKIGSFAGTPHRVTWSRTAERDIASSGGMTKAGVLEGILDHLSCDYVVHVDLMQNGDTAYIFNCFVERNRRYVKVKFWMFGDEERMHIMSAHPNR